MPAAGCWAVMMLDAAMMRTSRTQYFFNMIFLLFQDPSPQRSVGRLLAVNLNVQLALLQILNLLGSQVKRSGYGSLSRFSYGQVEERRSAHARGQPAMNLGGCRRAGHTFKC